MCVAYRDNMCVAYRDNMCVACRARPRRGLVAVGHRDGAWCGVRAHLSKTHVRTQHEMLSGRHPFCSAEDSTYQMHQHIIYELPNLDPYISVEAQSLLRGLLRKEPGRARGGQVERERVFERDRDLDRDLDWDLDIP